ncbi:SMC domain-containing protein, partial [Marine Group I thaumarchaeote SCGC AAA799-N04]
MLKIQKRIANLTSRDQSIESEVLTNESHVESLLE